MESRVYLALNGLDGFDDETIEVGFSVCESGGWRVLHRGRDEWKGGNESGEEIS